MKEKSLIIFYFFGIFLSNLPFQSFSQSDTAKFKSRWLLQYDGRHSIIEKNYVHIKGVLAGKELNSKQQVYFGYYFTLNPFGTRGVNGSYVSTNLGNVNTISKYHLHFFNTSFEHIYFENQYIKLSIPLELGFGIGKTQIQENYKLNNQEFKNQKTIFTSFLPIQLGTELEYKIRYFLSLRSQVGYRYSILNQPINHNSSMNYSGVYFTVGLRFYVLVLYKHYYPHTFQ